MKINKAYKTELHLNNKQITLMIQCSGCARFVYNWALSKRIEEYKNTKKSSNAIAQHRELNKLKQSDLAWLYQYSKTIPQNELRNLDKAFQNFFRRVRQKKGKAGFPKFKSRKTDNQSFRLDGAITVEANRIKLPRIGWLSLKESNYIPADVKILSATVSKHANKWFISVQTEEEKQEVLNEYDEVLGIDLGIKNLAVCSDGQVFENHNALKCNLIKLKRLQRKFAKQTKGGKNWGKTKQKIGILHFHVANIRNDYLHKITSELVKDKQVGTIVIEDLAVSNMVKNRKLSRAISDLGLYEFRRQLEYKCKWNGINLVIADRFFPSTKLCSCCGHKNDELMLADREWVCPVCKTEHNRDLNAANNLKNYTVSSTGIEACGEKIRLNLDEQFSMKQEINMKFNNVRFQ